MGATYELTATVREKVGKGAARATRRDGLVPAVVYGGKQTSLAISLPNRAITNRIHAGGFYTTLATIEKLCIALGCEPGDILELLTEDRTGEGNL